MLSKHIPLGIYEKALPAGTGFICSTGWLKALGFDFVEMSMKLTPAQPDSLGRGQRFALVNTCRNRGARALYVPERPSALPLGQRRRRGTGAGAGDYAKAIQLYQGCRHSRYSAGELRRLLPGG